MLLVREHEDLPHAIWNDGYLTFKNQIVGFARADAADLAVVYHWLTDQGVPLRAFAASISGKLFTQKATNLAGADILALPFPEGNSLDLSENERIVAEDVVAHYRDFVRRGNESALARAHAGHALPDYIAVFCSQINGVYRNNPLVALGHQRWPGVICQPFAFGGGEVDWSAVRRPTVS